VIDVGVEDAESKGGKDVSLEMNFMEMEQICNSMATRSHVAKCTWEGVKHGRFLITTDWVGYLIAAISRGATPEDSIATNVGELLLLVPMRLLSFVLHRIWTRKSSAQAR